MVGGEEGGCACEVVKKKKRQGMSACRDVRLPAAAQLCAATPAKTHMLLAVPARLLPQQPVCLPVVLSSCLPLQEMSFLCFHAMSPSPCPCLLPT